MGTNLSSRVLAALCSLLLVAAAPTAAGASTAATAASPLVAGTFDPPRVAPDFSLRGSDGNELTLGRYRGKVVILGFGFTSCPAICPTTLSVLAQARKKLAADASEIQVVYVTVDPQRDDEKRLHDFLAGFDATFVGGTGSEEQLAAVRTGYGVSATRMPFGESYGFNHSSFTYLIDRDGNLRALMPYGHTPDDYVHDVRILLGR